jgi:hypothetical protein
MSKPFVRYEDVPLLLAHEGEDPTFIFANNASIGVSQQINSKKFDDDYKVSLAMQTGDVYFPEAMESGFTLGPKDGPAYKVPESIEVIRAGAKISFPSEQSLVLTEDLHPGDYHVRVRSTGETLLSYNNDIEFGEVDVVRHYAAENGARGNLSISYYMNTGNVHSFFNITGLINKEVYPQVHEGKITGSLGDYKFNDAYIRELSFSARPYEIIEARVSIDIFGTLDYQSGISQDLFENGYYSTRREQITVPHAVGTKIEGIENIGMEYPLDFTYTVSVERVPTYEIDASGNMGEGGEVPVRVNKQSIDITAQIMGEKLDPYLQITGQRADLNVKLSDIGFSKEFTDNNQGLLGEFRLIGNVVYPEQTKEMQLLESYGVVDSDNLSVSDQGYLKGRASIKQSYR